MKQPTLLREELTRSLGADCGFPYPHCDEVSVSIFREHTCHPLPIHPPATNCATSLIDIVALVADFILHFDSHHQQRTLCAFARVSQLWHYVAQPLLWRFPGPLDNFNSQALFALSAAAPNYPGHQTRCLALTWYPISSQIDLLLKIATHCPNVISLDLQRGPTPDIDTVMMEDIEILSQLLPMFPLLRRLRIDQYDGSALLNNSLVLPAGRVCLLPELSSLYVSGIPHLHLCVGEKLQTLQISSWTRLPSACIATFAGACTKLRVLRLRWQVSDDDVCAFVSSCPLLEVLDVIQIRDDSSVSSHCSLWIHAAAMRLMHMRCLRTNIASGAANILALSRSCAPLETVAFNRLELCDEALLVAFVRAHKQTLRHVTFANWDAMTVLGVPAGLALIHELTRCARLECLEIEFNSNSKNFPTLKFMDGWVVDEVAFSNLLDGCPRLARTQELVALAKSCSDYDAVVRPRIEAMPVWEDILRNYEDDVMSW